MMIPGTALPATRPVIDDTVQPVQAAKAISDFLSEFSPGQRLQAVIQGQTANGTYRAIIAQRDVTLALPFSVKTGDALELEVVETQGRLALAVIAKPDAAAAAGAAGKDSVTATLSQTARLIGTLMTEQPTDQPAKGTPLNAGQALVATTAGRPTGDALAPALARALTQSGLFFEAHQAAWVAGKATRESLLLEPQGRLPASPMAIHRGAPGVVGGNATAVAALVGLRSDAVASALAGTAPAAGPGAAPAAPPGATPGAAPASVPSAAPGTVAGAAPGAVPTVAHAPGSAAASAGTPASMPAAAGVAIAGSEGKVAAPALSGASLPSEIRPIVQQQLSALASNVYAFHGQAWPGQDIHWEIIDADGQSGGDALDDEAPRWRTRLRLSLPSLGAVDAALTLQSGRLAITLDGRDEDVVARLNAGVADLRQHLQAAGVTVASVDIHAAPPADDAHT